MTNFRSEVPPVSCDWARRLMVLADALSDSERVALEEHIASCPACARQWRHWQRLGELLASLPSLPVSSEETQRLRARLAQVTFVPQWDCSAARQAVWRWVDSDLSPQERSSFVVHLANCDKCQALLWQAEQTIALLRSLPRVTASEAEKAALKAKLQRLRKRPTLVSFLWRVAMPVAAAATVLLAVTQWWQSVRQPLPQPPTTVARRPAPLPLEKPSVRPQQPEKPSVVSAPSPRIAQGSGKPSHPVLQPKSPRLTPPSLSSRPARLVRVPRPPLPSRPTLSQPMLPFPEPKLQPSPSALVAPTTPSVEAPAVTAPQPVLLPPAPSESLPTPSPSTSSLASIPLTEEPKTAALSPEPQELKPLAPITIEGDLSLQPPRVQLTVVPPSQRLYQRSGVALVTVPPEKRPIRPAEEQALSPDLSIPLAAERYRSHTAAIPFFRFGISW